MSNNPTNDSQQLTSGNGTDDPVVFPPAMEHNPVAVAELALTIDDRQWRAYQEGDLQRRSFHSRQRARRQSTEHARSRSVPATTGTTSAETPEKTIEYSVIIGGKLKSLKIPQNLRLECQGKNVEKVSIGEEFYCLKECSLVRQDGKEIIEKYDNPCSLNAAQFSIKNLQKIAGAKRHMQGISIDHTGNVEVIYQEHIPMGWEEEYHQQKRDNLSRDSSDSSDFYGLELVPPTWAEIAKRDAVIAAQSAALQEEKVKRWKLKEVVRSRIASDLGYSSGEEEAMEAASSSKGQEAHAISGDESYTISSRADGLESSSIGRV
jgi:hypothetical protein